MGYWDGVSFIETQEDYIFHGRYDAEQNIPTRVSSVADKFKDSYTEGYNLGLYFKNNITQIRDQI